MSFVLCTEAATGEVLLRKGVLRNFAKFTGKHLCHFIKIDTLALVFSCEFCEISKNTFFIEQHRWYWEISCIVKLKDRPQISRLILREFKQINELLSPPEIMRKPMVADHFKRVIEVN